MGPARVGRVIADERDQEIQCRCPQHEQGRLSQAPAYVYPDRSVLRFLGSRLRQILS